MPIEFAFPLNHILIPDRMSTKTITTNTTTTIRACPNRTEIVNRKSKSIRFRESLGRGVQTKSKREKRNAAEKHGRAATYGPFKTMYNMPTIYVALGNTDPPEQQAYTTTFRPWEVVGPPMGGGVARPALTPRDQTSNYTENELAASFSRTSGRSLGLPWRWWRVQR